MKHDILRHKFQRGACIWLLMLVGFVLLGCRSSNYMDESHLDSISDFQSAIRDKQFETAYALLSTEVQAKISNDEFTAALSNTNGDYAPLIDLFRDHQVATPPASKQRATNLLDALFFPLPTIRTTLDEFRQPFNQLAGYNGVVRTVTVKEGDAWRIANLIDHAYYSDSSVHTSPQDFDPVLYLGTPYSDLNPYEDAVPYNQLTQALRQQINRAQFLDVEISEELRLDQLLDLIEQADVAPVNPDAIYIVNLCDVRRYACYRDLYQFNLVWEDEQWRVAHISAIEEVPPSEQFTGQ